ncbi:MAG: alpha/beta hydrolase [Alphaproteobacteria bacterium]|nr:MAG: alpha/beta hydrolase [Alphaproteobacteria bacterium]
MPIKHVRTSVLDIAYEESGAADGTPVVLLHGFPYDPRAYDGVVPLLTAQGCRAIIPYLRGYGPTRFLAAETMRSGEQAALGNDLKELLEALAIERAFLCGYDWGGRAACIVAALWPERVRGLVSCGGYNVHDVAASTKPAEAEQEHRYWYQYYFHTERGRAGLTQNRRGIARLLWTLWSPHWRFDDATFDATAAAFDNPDFVDVVIHSYRVRYGYTAGDPAFAEIEQRLAAQPAINVPTIVLQGEAAGTTAPEASAAHAKQFTGRYRRRTLPLVGHNVPQEAPRETADAVLELVRNDVTRA